MVQKQSTKRIMRMIFQLAKLLETFVFEFEAGSDILFAVGNTVIGREGVGESV